MQSIKKSWKAVELTIFNQRLIDVDVKFGWLDVFAFFKLDSYKNTL